MSSFKRKLATKTTIPAGARPSPSSPTTLNVSTGLPALDDILGGGLPLSCLLLVVAPDPHSAYGELLQKFFVAQGIAREDDIYVIDNGAEKFIRSCPWVQSTPSLSSHTAADEVEDGSIGGDRIRIAWRYGHMRQFQTTVQSPSSSSDDFCTPFSLAAHVPDKVFEEGVTSGRLKCVPVSSDTGIKHSDSELDRFPSCLRSLEETLRRTEESGRTLRICVPSIGSPEWGDVQPYHILRILHYLRALLRQYHHVCASICLSPHLSSESWGGPGWTQKLSWLADGCITLAAFGADSSLAAMFPSHHGFLHIHSVPSPHTLLPPSDKFSTLRGLASSASGSISGGIGENNLAFKCTRKRLLFETLHLDLEGGVGERRTTPAALVEHGDHADIPASEGGTIRTVASEVATVEIRMEDKSNTAASANSSIEMYGDPSKRKPGSKAKKQVAFHSVRPEIYDF